MKKQIKKQMTRFLCLMLTMVSLFSLSVSAFAAAPALPNGLYVLYSINKHMGVNVLYKEGNNAQLGTDRINGESNEIFILEAVGVSGYCTLRPWHAQNSYVKGNGQGEVLTLKSGIPSDYSAHWKPIPVGNNQYVFANRANPSLVIDCSNGHIGQEFTGNRYILWERNGYAEAQSLYPVRISEKTNKLTPANRIYPQKTTCSFVAAANLSMAINAQYAKGAGARVVLDNLSNPAEKNEVVEVIPVKDGLYRLSFQHSPDTCIAASDIFTDSGITLKNFNKNDPFCLWEIYKVGSGWSFRNAGNLLMLDNYCNGSRAGNPIISYSYTGDCDPQIFMQKNANSTSSSSVSSGSSSNSMEQAVLLRLNDMMNGRTYNGDYKLNTKYTGQYASEQCKGFSKSIHLKLFGYNIGSTCSKPNNYKINYSSSNTKLVGSLTSLSSKNNSTIRALFDGARAGDFIQVRRTHSGSHSMIYLYSDSNSVTVYECNVDGKNGIIKKTYNWSAFRSANQAVSVYTAKNYKLK